MHINAQSCLKRAASWTSRPGWTMAHSEILDMPRNKKADRIIINNNIEALGSSGHALAHEAISRLWPQIEAARICELQVQVGNLQ